MNPETRIFKTISSVCIVCFLYMLVLSIAGCDKKPTPADEDGDPDNIECPEGLVGPEGGILEFPPDSPYYGVKIIIPPGSLEYCHSLYYNTYYDWQYPATGFTPQTARPFNFNLGIHMNGDSVRFRISFPIQNVTITDSTSQILCAYHYDPELPCYLKWHIVIPSEINDSTMIIDTERFYGTWSWGLVSLYEVDYECFLKPVMGDVMSQEKWDDVLSQIGTTIDTTFLAADFSFDCIHILLVRNVFEALYLALGDQMAKYQTLISPIAGNCNVLNPIEFFEGAVQYLGLLALSSLVQIAGGIVDGGILSGFITKLMEKAVNSQSCDYAAFMAWTDEQFWGYFSLYCFYYMMIHLMDWFVLYSGYIYCPTWIPTTIVWE